jgi:glutaredoxin-related protein
MDEGIKIIVNVIYQPYLENVFTFENMLNPAYTIRNIFSIRNNIKEFTICATIPKMYYSKTLGTRVFGTQEVHEQSELEEPIPGSVFADYILTICDLL